MPSDPRRHTDDRAASSVEYALLLTGIAAVIFVAVVLLGTSVATWFLVDITP